VTDIKVEYLPKNQQKIVESRKERTSVKMGIFHSLYLYFLAQLSSISKTLILTALKRIEQGQIRIIVKDNLNEVGDTKPEIYVFGTGKPEAEMVVKSKTTWTRLVMNFDLVRRHFLFTLHVNYISNSRNLDSG